MVLNTSLLVIAKRRIREHVRESTQLIVGWVECDSAEPTNNRHSPPVLLGRVRFGPTDKGDMLLRNVGCTLFKLESDSAQLPLQLSANGSY